MFLDTLKDTKALAPFMEINAFRKAFDEGGLSKKGKGSFQELFSEALEQYMLSGKASSTEIRNVFESLLSVINDTFMTLGMGDRLNSRLRNSFNLSDDTAAAFNRIFEERGMPAAEDSSIVQNRNNDELRHSSVDSGSLNGNYSDDNISEEGRYGFFRGLRETDNASEGNSGNVQAGSGKLQSVSEEDRKDDGRQYYNERARYLRRRADLRIRKYSPELVLKFNDNFSDDNGITSKDFFDSISSIKKENGDDGLLVDVHTIEEYDNMRLFLSEDKKTGFAITDDGDLVSVFNSPDTHGRMKEIMANAILIRMETDL